MVEALLRELELLLEKERSVLDKLAQQDPPEEGEKLLEQLAAGLERCGGLLARLGAAGAAAFDRAELLRLQELKKRREANSRTLAGLLEAAGKKLAALRLEQKALGSYRPAASSSARFLDWEG